MYKKLMNTLMSVIFTVSLGMSTSAVAQEHQALTPEGCQKLATFAYLIAANPKQDWSAIANNFQIENQKALFIRQVAWVLAHNALSPGQHAGYALALCLDNNGLIDRLYVDRQLKQDTPKEKTRT